MTTTRLCRCGNCEDYIDRAFGLAEKALVDDECAHTVIALGCALVQIGTNLNHHLLVRAAEARNEYSALRHVAIIGQIAKVTENIDISIDKVFGNHTDNYAKQIEDIFNRNLERIQKKADLPKGA